MKPSQTPDLRRWRGDEGFVWGRLSLLVEFEGCTDQWLRLALQALHLPLLGGRRALSLWLIDSQSAQVSPWRELLLVGGFVSDHQGLVRRGGPRSS